MEIQMDALTGMPQQRGYLDLVDDCLGKHPQESFCMLTTDIEHFSYFNKWYGRSDGDRLLSDIANFLKRLANEEEMIIGYMGADRFSAFFKINPNLTERIRQGIISILQKVKDNEVFRPIFGGFVWRPEMRAKSIDLFDYTINAIQQAVGNLKSSIFWFDEDMARQLMEEMELMPKVTYGMENGQFTFFLQPKCQLRDGRIVGAEVLMRWISSTGEVISPDRFIPALEKNGYIIQLDKYIWEKTCQVLRRWLDQGRRVLPVSVNISRVDIREMDVVAVFDRLLKEYRIPVNYLEVEITESAYVENEAIIKEAERGLRELGLKILIDDFGSGYSSLNMLKDIQADILKLDMQFLNMDENNFDKGRNIVSSVIAMANQIDLPVIAEGVENLEQSEMLSALGCGFAQGYYFYRPMSINQYEILLEDENNVAMPNIVNRKSGSSYLRDLAQYFAVVAEVNPFTGEYHFIHHDASFKFATNLRPDTISEYIDSCVQKGNVHPDDVPGYVRRTGLEFIRERLLSRSLRILYDVRFKKNGVYKWYTFECQQPKNFSMEEPWVLFTWKLAHTDASDKIDAVTLMHRTFRAVLKVNMRTGAFDIMHKHPDAPSALYRYSKNIMDFFQKAINEYVHPEDRVKYTWFVKPERIVRYFQENEAPLRLKIRCRRHDKWICTVAEIYRSIEYSTIKPVVLVTLLDCRTDSDLQEH